MTKTEPCHARADWYLKRIDDLLAALNVSVRPTGDEVDQCQSMLRELAARLRADLRPLPAGQTASPSERVYLAAIADAAALLRIPTSSRPTGRWREGLTACRSRIQDYVAAVSLPNRPMPVR